MNVGWHSPLVDCHFATKPSHSSQDSPSFRRSLAWTRRAGCYKGPRSQGGGPIRGGAPRSSTLSSRQRGGASHFTTSESSSTRGERDLEQQRMYEAEIVRASPKGRTDVALIHLIHRRRLEGWLVCNFRDDRHGPTEGHVPALGIAVGIAALAQLRPQDVGPQCRFSLLKSGAGSASPPRASRNRPSNRRGILGRWRGSGSVRRLPLPAQGSLRGVI